MFVEQKCRKRSFNTSSHKTLAHGGVQGVGGRDGEKVKHKKAKREELDKEDGVIESHAKATREANSVEMVKLNARIQALTLVAKSAEDQSTKFAGMDRDALSGLWSKNEKIKDNFSEEQRAMIGEQFAEMMLQGMFLTNVKEQTPMELNGAQSSSSQKPKGDSEQTAAESVAATPVGELLTADQQKAKELAIVNGVPIVAVTPQPVCTKEDCPELDEDAMDADLAS